MYLKEFDVETWMTNHEQNCQYNLADTCVSDMSIHELESLIHKRSYERSYAYAYGLWTNYRL